MATVYLAHDVKNNRPVAVKVMRPELADLLGRERFFREIEIAAKLQHANIVPLYDSGVADGLLYYVMPFVEGESLRDRLDQEKQLPIEDALHIAREVADALAYAHSVGLVHRDVKPGNILLAGGHALVADFGLARAITVAGGTELTERGIAVGTPAYMSPEQGSGQDAVDGRSDVYSLGCVLYEMLAGDPPFSGRTAQAIIARHQQERPPSLRVVRPTVSLGVQRAIETALAKVPADRHPTPLAFTEALDAASPSRERRRWRVAVPVVVAAVALLLLGSREIRSWFLARHVQAGDLSRIAVLYFDDASDDGRLQWLARGLTEDLIGALGGVYGLTVTSPNGVRPFAGSVVAPDSIGRALNAGLLVDGTVEPVGAAGDSVRLSVRLVQASDGVLLDGLRLVRALREPLALRSDLTEDVEQLLRQRIGARARLQQERLAAGSDVAWENLRRAEELRDDGITLLNAGDTAGAAVRFDRADSLLAVAERSARVWVGPTIERAKLALTRALGAADAATRERRLLSGLEHARRAALRAPDNPRALAVRGELLLRLRDFGTLGGKDSLIPGAFRDLTRATELDPGLARAWYTLSEVLRARGSEAESRLAAQKALVADIYAVEAPAVISRLLVSALNRGARGEADSLCAVGRRHYPDDPNFLECELTILGWFGSGRDDITQGWVEVRRLDTIPSLLQGRLSRRLLVAAILARSGLADSARGVLEATRALSPDERSWRELAVYEAYVRVLLGERARTIQLLRGIVAEDPSTRMWLADQAWFQILRKDPEFRRLVQSGR